jgi:hypothetical protein
MATNEMGRLLVGIDFKGDGLDLLKGSCLDRLSKTTNSFSQIGASLLSRFSCGKYYV